MPVYLQTPSVVISDLDEKELDLDLSDTPLMDILHDLESHTKSYIFNRSESFFGGKRFSEEKIENSFVSTLSGNVLETIVSDHIKIKDQRDNSVNLLDLKVGERVIAILGIDGLSFSASSIHMNFTVHQLKVYRKDILDDWLITDEEKPEPVHRDVPSEAEVNFLLNHPIFDEDNKTVIADEELNRLDDLKNDDDLAFF